MTGVHGGGVNKFLPGDETWDNLLPFRNQGDVAQIISPAGEVIHSVSWNDVAEELPRPDGSFYFKNTWLSNKSIQLMNSDFANKDSYRVSGYSSPGEPNSPENENFINNLKNGVINKFGDFEVRVIKNQTKNKKDAEIEIELLNELDPDTKWELYIDEIKQENSDQDSNNPFIVIGLFGGTKTILLKVWNEEMHRFCPFEKTIQIPIDDVEETELCEGDCKTLQSKGDNCVAWIDEKGKLLKNGNSYTICPTKSVTITELIENAQGLVMKRIIHRININRKNYTLFTDVPDECPPSDIALRIYGDDLTIEWDNNTTDSKRTVTSPGEYHVTVTNTKTGCTNEETFTVSNDIFNDSDGDGVCDNEDCNPNDNTKTYKIGDPCDDGLPCTVNDKYDSDCNCTGEIPKYGLTVAITGDNNICYYQETTTLKVDASGGTEPYEILWSTGETTSMIEIKEISQGGGDIYSVTVTDATGCSQEESIELIRYDSNDSDGDGFCDDVDCAPYSAEIGGPGSPCDDGDPNTIHDVHDENCNCVGTPNPCETDIDGDGICDECNDGSGSPNGLVPPCPEKDCNDLDPAIGSVGSPCDDEDPNTINDRMNEECECVGERKKVKAYQFLVEGNYYYDNSSILKKPIYICPKNIPFTVTVVSSNSNHTPVSELCSWEINGKQTNETSSTINIELGDFETNKVKLNCEFTETTSGKIFTMNIKISKDIELEFTEHLKKYQYDDNKIQAYRDFVGYGEKLGTPWNFIEESSFDKLRAEVSKSSGYYAVNNIKANSLELSISPLQLSKNKEDITFAFNGSGKQIIEINGCDKNNPELLLYTAPKKRYNVYFYNVCETDDDIPHYCETDRSKEEDCVTPIQSADYIYALTEE